jgi:hypothetical protein
MNNPDGKLLVLVCKSGPAFEGGRWSRQAAEDELRAGFSLDRLDVPREVGGRVLSLAERVNWLLDQRQPGSIDLSVANSDSAYINAR